MVDFDAMRFVVKVKLDGFDHFKPPVVEGVFAGDVGACKNLCRAVVFQDRKRKQSDFEVGTESIFRLYRLTITRLNS